MEFVEVHFFGGGQRIYICGLETLDRIQEQAKYFMEFEVDEERDFDYMAFMPEGMSQDGFEEEYGMGLMGCL